MGFVSDSLQANEQVVAKGKIHWIIFVLPAVLLLLGVLFYSSESTQLVGIIFLVLGLFYAVKRLIIFLTQEFAATNQRLIGKSGVIARDSLDIRLKKVESIKLKQGIVGRMFNFGTLVVNGAGSSSAFTYLSQIKEFRKQISEMLAEVES
jgi:uncharacterized membrane protein YdbT with pleckstrin-like domain